MITKTAIFRPKLRRRHFKDNPRSLANLIPYTKGHNGHGRVYPLKERLQHALDHPLTEPKPGAPHGDVIVFNTLKGAAELVPVAFRETWDRVEGKVPEQRAIVGDIRIEVVYEERKKAIDVEAREVG